MQWPFDEWGVDVVLNGHDHTYERLEKDGVWYFVTGNSGWNLRSSDCGVKETAATSYYCYDDHYGAMRISATDSRLLLEELAIDDGANGGNGGKLIDSLTLPEPLTAKPKKIRFQDGVSPTTAYAGTIDTTISEKDPTVNFGNADECYVDGNDPDGEYLDKSVLLKWDVSELPSDEIISSASITLRVTNSSSNAYPLYELKPDWQELQATWQRSDSGINWGTPGAQGASDRGSTSLGSFAAPSTGFQTIDLNSAGLELVQSWVNDANANQGIIIADSSINDGIDFYCRDASSAAYRPQLTIEYGQGSVVEWIWSGGVTADSAQVNAKLVGASNDVWLAVSKTADFSSPLYFGPYTADAGNNYTVAIPATGLEPLTSYFYAISIGSELDEGMRGEFQTFSDDPFSFTFAFAGDAYQGSNATVYDDLRQEDALFFLSPGDFMYADINTDDVDLYRAAFADSLTADRQSQLYRSLPIAYMWDDHDYGANDSDKDSPSRPAALQAYREIVPSYHLDAGTADAPIYQAFSVGHAYFILTDLRSEKDPDGGLMMGGDQMDWFKKQLAYARDNYYLPIFWVSSVPWIAPAEKGADHWGGYAAQRTEIANYIKDEEIPNVFILSADAHMLAVDDGSNSDYADGYGAPLPVFHAAALNQVGSFKGGPDYSEGYALNPSDDVGQYALVTVNALGKGEAEVIYNGKRQTVAAGASARGLNGVSETETILGPWSKPVTIDIPLAAGLIDFSPAGPTNSPFPTSLFAALSALLGITVLLYWRNWRQLKNERE